MKPEPAMGLSQVVARVGDAYRSCLPKHKYYVRAKLKTDPLTRELFEWLSVAGPLGHVLDAGCGRGQFSLCAAACAEFLSLRGFDLDEQKVDAARQASQAMMQGTELRPVYFEAGDLRIFEFPICNTVFAFDVLHYLAAADQERLVERLCSSLAPGGRLLIRETNQEGGLGAQIAASFERMGRWLGINRGVTLEFREPGALERQLRQHGLQVETRKARGALQNVLLIASHDG